MTCSTTAARPSADRVLPELQDTQVGDGGPMSSKVNERTAFKVRAFQPTQWLRWAKPDSTWAWGRSPAGRRPHPPGRIRFELGDFPMLRKLLLG